MISIVLEQESSFHSIEHYQYLTGKNIYPVKLRGFETEIDTVDAKPIALQPYLPLL